MKTRIVMVTLELETNIGIGELRDALCWQDAVAHAFEDAERHLYADVHQVQVSVQQPPKPKGKRRAAKR